MALRQVTGGSSMHARKLCRAGRPISLERVHDLSDGSFLGLPPTAHTHAPFARKPNVLEQWTMKAEAQRVFQNDNHKLQTLYSTRIKRGCAPARYCRN